MRDEQDIFDDLARLCTSPGYVHAIAFICFKDNFVWYAGDMTAEDMRHMFSRDRLIRTEVQTLIGLLIKGHVDYSLVGPDVLQGYIEKTYAVLEELHRAMSHGMIGELGLQKIVETGLDWLTRGEALREPIFYGPESAYSFQYRDLAVGKYVADNEWLRREKGFSIETARDVVRAVGKFQDKRLTNLVHDLRRVRPDEWTLLPGFSFTGRDIAEFSRIDKSVVEKVLDAFTVPDTERNQGFRSLHDFNIATAAPLLKKDEETFVLFAQYSLVEALYDSPFYWMRSDTRARLKNGSRRKSFS